jgi:internalin A
MKASRNIPKEFEEKIRRAKEENLKELELRPSRLTDRLIVFPDSIAELVNLAKLDLSYNNLAEIPESITRLVNLTTLNLSVNELTEIPEYITKLVNLTKLNLSSNNLTELPESITRLVKLTTLNLGYNRLTELPESITRFVKLTTLDLGMNELTYIPDSIIGLKNLKKLYLNDNNLTEIPDSITRLRRLITLGLGGNKLIKIPDSIARLMNLNALYLGHNNLTDLPDSITELKNLTTLNLSYNGLTKIPDSITRLENLIKIYLDGNPIEIPPPEVVKKGIQAIREYFRQIQTEGEDHLYEAKLLIVGEPGAGKTSLAKKMENKNYVLQPNQGSTEGIDVITWNFKMDNGQNFRTNIWDFGGQQIYHATHQFFLTKRSFYVLVCDMRKEDTDFYYWLSIIELLSNNSPLIIVKNEVQDRKRDISERQLRGQFTSFKEIFATNLGTNRGLDEIVKAVKHYMTNLSIVGTPLPKTWVKVREALEKDKRNYISIEEFMEICDENGFKQDKDKLQLSGYLHDIGVCLHFQDDMILREKVILKPEWGTDAVYKVLDNEKVINNYGKFNYADLASIWNESKYNNIQAGLLQLMLNFKLCYEIPGTDNTNKQYIAPQLLTKKQPEYEWDKNENLILRYECSEFMPEGILSRFIVEIHRYITDESLVWKSGVILERDRTKAEVIENYGRREITIRVVGMHKKELITLITDKLDMIHDSFNRLKYKKLIPCNCSKCRNTQEPYFHEYKILRKFDEDRQENIQCLKSYEWVNVRKLIDDVIEEKKSKKPSEKLEEPTVIVEQKKPQKPKCEPSNSSDVIRILHLSDLHITEDIDVLTILNPLVTDLNANTWSDYDKLDHRLDYIAISGDFSNKAKKEEFEKAKEFVSQLADTFGLSTECCILVPGNHDQSWDEEVYDWKKKRNVNVSELKDGFHKEQSDGYLIRDDDKYPKRFNNFSDYLYQPLIGSQYSVNFENQAFAKLLGDTGVLFLTLNSSWKIDEYFPKRANINEDALARGLMEVSKITEEHKDLPILKIALWHHPVNDDEKIENKDIMEQIREANFRFVLHGHVHEEKYELLYHTHKNSIQVVGAGTFGAKMKDRPQSTPFLYNLLEISRDHSKVRIHTRYRKTEGGAWGPYAIHEGDKPGEKKSYYDI